MKSLNLSLNAISEFPDVESFPLLETFDLSHNRFHDLPSCLANFTALSSFNMAGNRLEHFSGVVRFLPCFSHLRLNPFPPPFSSSLPSFPIVITSEVFALSYFLTLTLTAPFWLSQSSHVRPSRQ